MSRNLENKRLDSKNFRPDGCFFVLVMNGRCGSTLVTTILNQRRDALCYGETFVNCSAEMQRKLLIALSEGQYLGDISQAALDYTRTAQALHEKKPLRAVGMKTKLIDIIEPGYFRDFLVEHKFKVIHLYRKNPIKAIISVLNAQRHVSWNLSDPKFHRKDPFRIDPNDFMKWFRHRLATDWALRDFAASYPGSTLSLSYEEILANQGQAMSRINHFLGLDDCFIEGLTIKMTNDSLGDVVENLDELLALFPKENNPLRYYRKFFDT